MTIDYNSSKTYEKIIQESLQDPESFWGQIGKLVTWTKPWSKVLDNSVVPFTKWFPGGELNACYNAVDRHVENGKGSKVAIFYDCPTLGVSKKITYAELQEKIMALSGVLSNLGVTRGDRVLIYMPTIPETVVAMLATARLGAVHAVVFGGFAPHELKFRLESCTPKVVIAANYGLEPNRLIDYLDNVKQAIILSAHKPLKTIVYQRKNINKTTTLDPELFLDWDQSVSQTKLFKKCISIEANEPLYILYTSGTTGTPKGVQRPIGGHLAVLVWSMEVLYGLKKDDVWWATSDFGWVVGHSYMCYAPLLFGITTVLYEGKPTVPDPSQYFRVIDHYKVTNMFTVPTVLRLLKKEDPEARCAQGFDISTLRNVFVAGEHCDLSSKMWASRIFKVEIFNHWWQTETGHAITASFLGLNKKAPNRSLSTGMPFPGYNSMYRPFLLR